MRAALCKHKVWIPGIIAIIVLFPFMFSRQEVVGGNVWAFGVPLGGLPKDQAINIVRDKLQELERGPLVFSAGKLSCQVSRDELKVILDSRRIISELGTYITLRPKYLPDSVFRRGPKTVLAAPAEVWSPNLEKVLANIAEKLSRPALGARYGFSGRDLVILPPEPGQLVTPEDVRKVLGDLTGTRIEVPYRTIEPPAGNNLEPLKLIAEFSTTYDEKDTDRNVNLMLAARAVHGKVLNPGDTYSFNKEAGERTLEKGYRYANVVVGDHLEPGLAGGICQVTTTLFNAAALAGLDFPEVHAHGIPVEYVPPGRDAAVAWDYLDLKITNNLGGPVVFGAWVENGQVVVRVFGKPGDKTYDLEPVIVKEYPEEGKNPGLLVETYRVEKVNGEVTRKVLLLRSHYLPSVPHQK
ncbi:MAG TPA: VanW family protein [Firmicutes bacterium]|nr:VanW family protein [Candidatus Fermentithermobacillaceae bacterium]